jgi:RHS repeat-associated protein
VKRRYGYGPTGEVLFDQVFNATGSQGLQGEQDLLLPLGDHQHSTRVVLAHDAGDVLYVRQSLDYAQFGRVTAIRDAAGALVQAGGAPDLSAIVTAFAHHGSLLDVATGLQLKSERWYSPDLGRFISEDPIQDGTNWFMFAGNNPVIYADPTGLYQQGYPLGGGYSGNVTRQPTIKPGYLPGNSLVTAATALYRGAQAIAPYAKSLVNSTLNSLARAAAASLVTAPPSARGGVTLRLAPEAEEAVIRQITAGANIKSRSAADLPGVRAALMDPNRYVVTNHNDQGYNVLAPDGSVRFVTGDDYIPGREQLRRAGIEGQSAAGRAQFFNLIGEGVIASNPFVETARDGGIYAFGYDFYNPNERQSEDDQHRAGQMFFLPGVNSKQVKYADDALDGLRRSRNQTDAVMQDLLEQQGMREIPAPTGRGTQNPLVREAIEEGDIAHALLQERLRQRGYFVDRADTAVIDPATGRTVYPDAISPNGRPIEIKPRTPTGQAKGESQLPQYERATGQRGRVIYYDR